ncbi:MAG: hypothetical protein V1932_06930 [Chloroflexota bacterium]
MAIDGTLYCYANPSGANYTLFKSTDAGYSWAYTGKVKDIITDIATASDDASAVYYATATNIYKSADAGTTFTPLPLNPGGAGSDNIVITSIDITLGDGSRIVAVGTKDTDSSQYGGVYILDENKPFAGWINTNIGSYDICTVAFSPNFATDRQLMAVVTDEKDTLITTRIGDGGWGRVIGDATIKDLTPRTAAIAFPDDYDMVSGDSVLFLAISAGNDKGDFYKVIGARTPSGSIATDLNIGSAYNLNNVDVTSLVVSGNTTSLSMLAGAANSAQVYASNDSGRNWTRSSKKPTGESKTCVLMAPNFLSRRSAYATTNGTESAFSCTTDGGITWNQVGLIDTRISSIVDLAVSPNYSQDNTLFLLTHDGGDSLWRSLNGGAKWGRVLTSTLANASDIRLVRLSPRYNNGSQSVFLAGTSGTSPTIWKSADNGQTFSRWDAPLSISTWTLVDDNTLFLGTDNGLVYQTNSGGLSYSTGVEAGNQELTSIALSLNYGQDKNILVGSIDGWVYHSADNGTSFKSLGNQLPLSSGIGKVTIAFDPEFSSNRIVYATSDAKSTTSSKERIYRFTIGKSNVWEGTDSTLPVGSMIGQVALSANGTFYATNLMANGGMERSLNPTSSVGTGFQTVTGGLDNNAKLKRLWLNGARLWSIDSQNTRLMTYTDSLTLPVTLTSPLNRASGINPTGVSLDWETLKGATKYQWQFDYDTDFSTNITELEGYSEASSVRLPTLNMATTYYWRVRATSPVLSPWSAKRSFTTSLGAAVNAPELYSPKAGDTGVPIKPVFQWGAIEGSDSYELLVSTDISFSSPVIVKTGDYSLPSTAWQSDISLDYNATYYWKVRASGSNSYSAWSAAGGFTTTLPPSEPSPSSSPQTSSSQSSPSPPVSSAPPVPSPTESPASSGPSSSLPLQSSLPGWVIYLVGVLLLVILLLLIILLMLVVRIGRF